MPGYDLNRIGDLEFERMIQALLKKVIGYDTITFGEGPDGGREAIFSGKAPYPSPTENWDGNWVFQVKFHDMNRIGADKSREEVKRDLKNELDKIVSKRKIDNYILATNVVLTAYPENGTIDEIYDKITPSYEDRIPHIRVWGYDDVSKFLDNDRDVRIAYGHLITPGDVLEELFRKLSGIPSRRNELSGNEIKEYLNKIIQTKYISYEHQTATQKGLRSFYINHNCKLLPTSYWKAADDYILEQEEFETSDALELVNETLGKETIVLIGAQFGIGKSTFARMLALVYAINFLLNIEKKTERKLFPIYVDLHNGLKVDYKHLGLQNFLDMLPTSDNIQPLLIFDGLDEIGNLNLGEEIDKIRKTNHDLKIIVTCRNQDDILEEHGLRLDRYIRLLPFSRDQFDLFCQKFGLKYENEILTFKKAEELSFPNEVLVIPLFLSIFAEKFLKQDVKILINSGWSPEMTKSFIFLILFYNIITGKYRKDLAQTKAVTMFRDEKKLLRFISALQLIFPFPTVDDFMKYKPHVLPNNSIAINGLPFVNLVNETKGNVIYLLKRIYFEYLLAEYYLEAIIERKLYKLSLVPPTTGTIEFLSGLLGLLKESVKNSELKKYVITGEFSFVNSIVDNQSHNQEGILEEIEETCIESLKKENSIGWHIEKEGDNVIKAMDGIWTNVNLSNEQTEDLLIHKWLILFVNRKLNPDKYLDDNKIRNNIAKMIKTFSNVIPPSLRFLPRVNLSGCNLSGTRLRDANLEGAILEGTNLESSDLNHARLTDANLSSSNLMYSDVSYAKCMNANFEHANLEGAILRNSDFTKSNFNECRFTGANLYRSNFENATLTNIDIFEDLLPSFKIGLDEVGFGPIIPLLICDSANFKNATFSDDRLISILKKRNAIF